MIKRIVLFLALNFAALAIGSLFTQNGVSSDWYLHINKAPWTPPGWVFGAAWTLIMVSFALYMAYLTKSKPIAKRIVLLFALQWVLNVAWNPIFFYWQATLIALICISLLTFNVAYLLYIYRKVLNVKSLLLAPYLVWLLIATSLNVYIVLFN